LSAAGVNREPGWIKPTLLTISLLFLALFIFMPLFTIFSEAFSKGVPYYFKALKDREVFAAIKLTLITAAICVPLNTAFGVILAWAVTKFNFRGKNILITLVEVPFAVSPVIAGLIFVFLFGAIGWFGGILDKLNLQIVFAVPGIFLATAFVTFPFVAKELIPLMNDLGKDDEEAAITLGAGGLKTFFRVTLPNIKWGLLYGIILTNARAMGEYGAVAVVSGLVRGKTTTMPLYIDFLYGEYHFAAAFGVASLLTFLALVTLILKAVLERFIAEQRKQKV
jgi:sulfate transport system permease protein